jgi:prolycopene isomerase
MNGTPAASGNGDYDVVVVGAGLGGLSAGACAARAGRRVLVIDRLDGPGGLAHAFTRGPYVFDPAIHTTSLGYPKPFLAGYLDLLGVGDLVELDPLDVYFGADLPGVRVTVATGLERCKEALAESFPEEKEGIARFLDLCVQVTDEAQHLTTRLSLAELGDAVERFPTLFRYRTATLAAALEDHVEGERARAACAAAWPHPGAPPATVSFLQYAQMLVAGIAAGVYCRGSFQKLADAFAAAIARSGGELWLETEVTRIGVEERRVTGVALADGTEIAAPVVVCNGDARRAVDELIGPEHVPGSVYQRYRRLEPSLSAFVLFTATREDPRAHGLAAEHFVHSRWDHGAIHQDVLEGRLGGMWISIPTMHDPSLAPPGEHLVMLTSLMPYDIGEPWSAARPRLEELALQELERTVPGLRESATFVESATPETFERYTLSQRGAAYGWANTPAQTTPKRLARTLGIEGLFLAGHWTEPGTGCLRSIYSGLLAAQMLLGYESPDDVLGSLAR